MRLEGLFYPMRFARPHMLTSRGARARAPRENVERTGVYLIETLTLVQLGPSKVMGDDVATTRASYTPKVSVLAACQKKSRQSLLAARVLADQACSPGHLVKSV